MSDDFEKMHINIIPLAVIGMLLTIVILSTADTWYIPSPLDIDLPEANTYETEHENDVSVTIDAHNRVAVDETEIEWKDLGNALRIKFETRSANYVILNVDQRVPYKQLIDAMYISRQAGSERITIATQQRSDL